MKQIKKIDLISLTNNQVLFGLASALREIACLLAHAKKNAPAEILSVVKEIDGAITSKFWYQFQKSFPEYAENISDLNGEDGILSVVVYDEKLEKSEKCETDDGETVSLDDIMEQAGVQNADDWGRA